MAVNINRANTDAFYRYKMPRLLSKIEGKGNGIKTVIPNMEDIAHSLSRPPSYPTKFFGCELGAQTTMDDKTSRYIVNGAHETKTLEELLDRFIKKFVLCQDCSNPETDMTIKREEIWLDCKACGSHRKADMNHKLCVFILKNPPANVSANGTPGKAGKKSKEERRKEKAERAKNGNRKLSDEGEDDEDEKPTTVTPPSEKKEEGTVSPDINNENEDESGLNFTPSLVASTNGGLAEDNFIPTDVNEEFTVDDETLTKARKELTEGLNVAVKTLVSKEDDANDGDEPSNAYEIFAAFLETGARSPEEIVAEIARLALKEDKALAVIVQVLFTDKLMEELPLKQKLLKQVVKSEKSVKGLLGGIERLVGNAYPQLIPKLPKVLKFFYDNDILEEEAILAWFDKPSKKYVDKEVGAKLRAAAQPLIDWLKTAEEESD